MKIPKEWLVRIVSIDEVEHITRGMWIAFDTSVPEGSIILDKSPHWQESQWKDHPQWIALKAKLGEKDEIWLYKAGRMWTAQTGTEGYVICVRGEPTDDYMTTRIYTH